MKALIFAAGLGTRLKPITDTLPKALVPVAGEPLLHILIEKLKRAGYTEVVINLHHFAGKIRDYVEQNNNFGIEIQFSDETDLLRETGGGIRHAATLLNGNEPFMVHNVDIISNLNFEDFLDAHYSESISLDTPLATLLVSERKTSRYLLFDEQNNLTGWVNLATGEVKSPFKELKREPSDMFDADKFLQEYKLKKYAFAGTHIISPKIFEIMERWPEKFSIIDFYIEMADKYIIKGYVKNDLELVDVGKLDSLDKAQELYLQLNNR